MQPLQALLHRIKGDAQFAQGQFVLGYYDRVVHQERIVPLTSSPIFRSIECARSTRTAMSSGSVLVTLNRDVTEA